MVEVLVRVCLDLGLKNNFLYFMQSIPKSNGVFYALLVKGKKKKAKFVNWLQLCYFNWFWDVLWFYSAH